MLDALNAPAAPHVTRREDYAPPEWLIPDVSLDFALGAERTIVRSRLEVTRNGEHKAPLRLNASGLTILDVRLDGGWHLVDATGLAPTETMVRICVGRDATDIAFMTIFGTGQMCAQSVQVTRLDE